MSDAGLTTLATQTAARKRPPLIECDDDYERARQQVGDGLTASSLAVDILKGLAKDKPSKGQGETEDDGSRRWRRHRGGKIWRELKRKKKRF